MPFSCQNIKLYSADYADDRLRPGDKYLISSHLASCEACTSYFEQDSLLRSTLHRLPDPPWPQTLVTKLRVIASQERAMMDRTGGSRWRGVCRLGGSA